VETKKRQTFDLATRRVTQKEVEITNTQNYYNQIMGYVDLNDLLAWQYRVNSFREIKFWWCVYLWIVRKRVDQAFALYMLLVRQKARELDEKLAGSERLAATVRADLLQQKRAFMSSCKSHYEFIEDVCAYHFIMGYNSTMRPDPPLASKDWKSVLPSARRTNSTKAAGASNKPDCTRKRGKPWDEDAHSWPADRLTGKHTLGWHHSGDHHCDFPLGEL
ncbi:MAG: hypothetical protein SGPRY_012297, partial [Prymnesium sp.]